MRSCLGCVHYHGNDVFGPSCFGDDLREPKEPDKPKLVRKVLKLEKNV